MIFTVVLLIVIQQDFKEYRCSPSMVLQAIADLNGNMSKRTQGILSEVVARYVKSAAALPKIDPEYHKHLFELEQELGAEIARKVDESERLLLFAKINLAQGYFSLNEKHVAKYLKLSEMQLSKVAKLTADFQGSITLLTKSTNQAPPSIYHEIIKTCDDKLYPAFKASIMNVLTEGQRSRLDLLIKGLDEQKICLTQVVTIVDAELNKQRILKLRAARPPNLKLYFNTNPILILGVDEILVELQIAGAQKAKILELYADCMTQCKTLQEEYRTSLGQEDTSDRYIKSAMLLSAEIKRRLGDVLEKNQKERVKQVFAQVIGPRLAFSGEYKHAIGIRADQEHELASFLGSARSEFTRNHGNPNSSAEIMVKYYQYSNELMLSVYFDEGQRTNWKKMIGKPLEPRLLEKLASVYYGHIPLNTPLPSR